MRGLGIVVIATLGACRIGFDERITTFGDGGGDGAAAVGFSAVDVGGEFSCGIFLDRAYCWGRNQAGELGTGDTSPRATPVAVALPAGAVTSISAGNTHACAIVAGQAYCWGTAILGDGTSTSSPTPVRVTNLPAPIVEITAGYDFSCAVAGGDGYCWGDDSSDRLGNGTPGSSATPVLVLPGATHMFAGGDHACGVRTDGTAACWGHNDGPGALGIGADTPTNAPSPLAVVTLTAVSAITIAGYHACAIDSGAAWCWGTGGDGELGNGGMASSNRPLAVTAMSSGVTAIHTGGGPSTADTACAIQSGHLFCWGSGLDGRSGTRDANDRYVPTEVAGLVGTANAISVGWYHTCAVVGSGEVECWGLGTSGQLGNGQSSSSFDPVVVVHPG